VLILHVDNLITSMYDSHDGCTDGFEIAQECLPGWARRRMLGKLKESLVSYLNHVPARPISPLPAIPMTRLFPPAKTVGPISEVELLETRTIGEVTVGFEPLIENWSPRDRYTMGGTFHDPLSLIGFTSSLIHEEEHLSDIISIGGLICLLAHESKIAFYKPLGEGFGPFRLLLDKLLKRAGSDREQLLEKLVVQLEANPTFVQLGVMTRKEFIEERFPEPHILFREAARVARPEYESLFRDDVLRNPCNRTHLDAFDLVMMLYHHHHHKPVAGCYVLFVQYATRVGLIGPQNLLSLSDKAGEKFRSAFEKGDWEGTDRFFLEVIDSSLEEYKRKLLDVLEEVTSTATGNTRARFRSIRNQASVNMRKERIALGWETRACVINKIGGKPYINRIRSKSDGVSDSDVEALLSFYVDYGLASQAEASMVKFLRSENGGVGKPFQQTLICPLQGAMQPAWCPDCSGRLGYELKNGILWYESIKGLNPRCPYIREWLGGKKLL